MARIPRLFVRLLDALTGRMDEAPILPAPVPWNPDAAPDPEARCAVCFFPLRLHTALGINSHPFTPERIDAPADAPHIPEDGI